jgi:hypothetical protein
VRKDDLCFRGEPVGESGDARGMLWEEWDGRRGGGGVAGILSSSSIQTASTKSSEVDQQRLKLEDEVKIAIST